LEKTPILLFLTPIFQSHRPFAPVLWLIKRTGSKGEMMKLTFARLLFGACCLVFCLSNVVAEGEMNDNIRQVSRATAVLKDIMRTDGGIPRGIFQRSRCIAVFPQVLKGGFIVGGRYGRGVASCRVGSYWSSPIFLRLAGGSFGLQIGGQATDLVLLFMNQRGLDRLVTSRFEIGGDASVAAGPVGRQVGAGTDITLGSQILSYSRSRGLFAGLELKGVSISQDTDNMAVAYGPNTNPRTVLTSRRTPLLFRLFPETLARYSRGTYGRDRYGRPPSTSLDRVPPRIIPQ
jgi:lipid-binding SYLF domain-containing protein